MQSLSNHRRDHLQYYLYYAVGWWDSEICINLYDIPISYNVIIVQNKG